MVSNSRIVFRAGEEDFHARSGPRFILGSTSQRPFLSTILMLIGGRTKSPLTEPPFTCTSLLLIQTNVNDFDENGGLVRFHILLPAHRSEVHSIDQTTGGLFAREPVDKV